MHFELSPQQLRERGGLLEQFLDVAFDSSILLDQDGYVLNCGNGATQLTMTRRSGLLGQHVTAFDKVSPFEEVLRTGTAVKNKLYVVQGRRCLQNIYPIFWEGRVVGALGVLSYTNMNDIRQQLVGDLAEHLSEVKLGDIAEVETENLIRARLQRNYTFEDFIGESAKVRAVVHECKAAATAPYPVLLLGESGTGKEILASAIHSFGMKSIQSPYIKINCTAIPNQLLESELFGYEKGAFTGATAPKKGRFEAARGGSILLDEIGDMDVALQGKLLRVLEEREFERVGGIKTIPLEARVISSTNSDLLQKCKDNRFRRDLYYRLSTVEIRIPPLRERPDDIPLLVSHFISRENLPIAITDPAMEAMVEYAWPGNVRELRNLIQRLGISCPDRPVRTDDVIRYFSDGSLAAPLFPGTGDSAFPPYVHIHPEQAQARETLLNVLREQHWNLSAAARVLHITRATLYKRLKKYNITVQRRGS